ncbi:MAG: glycosyltransferase [Gilvibacter sp.]
MLLSYSFIVPVYNRPDEVQELLDSLAKMKTNVAFEVVIVEDGSTQSSEGVVAAFQDKLDIAYFFKENSGPGDSRNYGMQRAKGNYFIILDSDCIIPEHYLEAANTALTARFTDCYGGPDAAHESFSDLQKAINYTMTSLLTTGGIRGNKHAQKRYEPRSFNMGISKTVFEQTKGFGSIHPGEDPDLSQRIKKGGFGVQFIEQAFVYHKRRISWSKFYKQVRKFGLVRPILTVWHPESAKITFWFPSLFLLGCIGVIALWIAFGIVWPLGALCGYLAIIFIDASFQAKNPLIGLMAVWATIVQFFGYGWAFIKSTILIRWLRRKPKKVFPELFFD